MGNVCGRDETETAGQDNQPTQGSGMVPAQPTSVVPGQPTSVVPGRREQSPVQSNAQSGVQGSVLSQSSIASDWETTKTLNKANPKAQQAFQNKKARNVTDYPELKEYHAHPTSTLKNLKNKDTYQGQTVRGIPEGWGILYGSNGEIVEGLFKDGQPHSHLRYYFADGSMYEGQFKDNHFEGEGTLYKADGTTVYSKEWAKGKIAGYQEEKDFQGRLIFAGRKTPDGYFMGNCTVSRNDFTVQGEFSANKPTGIMTKTYTDGRVYRGPLNKDMEEEGTGEITFVDDRRFKGPFVRGQPHGAGSLINNSGKEVKATFTNGRRVIA